MLFVTLFRSMRLLCLFIFSLLLAHPLSAAKPGLFFDPSMPVHATSLDAGNGDLVARGLLLRLSEEQYLLFDQELLRPVTWFSAPANKEPISLNLMAQASWYEPTKKAGAILPRPATAGKLLVPALPGIGVNAEVVLSDPRPDFGSEKGRGGLEASERKFLGYDVSGTTPVLHYRIGTTQVKEWYALSGGNLLRNFAIDAGKELVFLAAKGEFTITSAQQARSDKQVITSNHAGLRLASAKGHVIATLAASTHERLVTLAFSDQPIKELSTTTIVAKGKVKRWSQSIETTIQESERSGPGWTMDRMALPLDNPWRRRVRPADITFLPSGKCAVVTFCGDVWLLAPSAKRVAWKRIAAGLCEPLSIGHVGETIQVFSRSGLVRLHDRNGDGETDFYENHSSLMTQTVSTRGYPLDMEVDETGRTWASIGGIALPQPGVREKGPGSPHGGAVFAIAADGKSIETIAQYAREPFFARDPQNGNLAMSDQQGNYVPSSGIFPLVKGGSYGFGGRGENALVPPAAWIPHEQDTSSASPLWMRKTAFAAWEGGLMNISYGTGRLFLVRPSGTWPSKQGSVIPLGIETGLPILHARTHPIDGSIWLTGFRIYDSRVEPFEGIGRLRRSSGPLAQPVDAMIVAQGIVLRFDAAIDPSSIDAEKIQAREWQYRRSPAYGSPRFKRDGSQGVDAVATGKTWLSKDGKSVFIHIPHLKPTMQLELIHHIRVKGVSSEATPVYFTVANPQPAPWIEWGFSPPQLDGSIASVKQSSDAEPPSVARGLATVTRFGCIACHSSDGTKEGHSGPTWKGIAGNKRSFKDGSSAIADEAYLRQAILQPEAKIVSGYELGMASYAGVLSESELKSVIFYIQSLK
jgi:cytochrome c2